MSSYEPPFCELFKAAYRADIFSTDFDDFCIGPAVHGVVADGAAELYSLAGLLRLEEGVDIHGHIRFRQVFSVQATARDAVRHIRAQLPVGRTGVHVRATRPVAQGIDLGLREQGLQLICGSIALTEDEPVAVQDVLSIRGLPIVDGAGDAGELLLLRCDTHSFEDAVVAAAETVTLVVGEMCVLCDLGIIQGEVPGNTVGDAFDSLSGQMRGGLYDDVAHVMAEEDFHGDARVRLLRIGEVDQSTGDAVCDFIRMCRIYFFIHGQLPFRARSRRSIVSSIGVTPLYSVAQFSFTIWYISIQSRLVWLMKFWLIAT